MPKRKKQKKNGLSAAQFAALQKQIGWDDHQLAARLNTASRNFFRYRNDERAVPGPVGAYMLFYLQIRDLTGELMTLASANPDPEIRRTVEKLLAAL